MKRKTLIPTVVGLCAFSLLAFNGCFLFPSQPSYSPAPTQPSIYSPEPTYPSTYEPEPEYESVPESTYIPEPEPTYRQWEWQPSPGRILDGGMWAYFPAGGAYVEAGRTLTLHWSSDSSLDGFILTANQFENMDNHIGVVSTYLAKESGTNKTITAHISHGDKYYAVVRNLSALAPSVKLYEATLTEK